MTYTAARRIGISNQEYMARRAAGQSWCTGHKAWHPVTDFSPAPSRSTGCYPSCRAWHAAEMREWRAGRAS